MTATMTRAIAVCLVLSASTVFAQAPNLGTLRVTVVDPSGAVIVGATVTAAGAEDTTRTSTLAPAQTSDSGIATFSGLTPGRSSPSCARSVLR